MPVEEKLKEWISQLDPVKSRIKIFEKIRDIPFTVSLKSKNYIENPLEVVACNNGSCSSKHYLLGIMFEKISVPIKYVSFLFLWGSLDLDYPLNIRKLAEEMPVVPHLACKANINKKYVLVDATWDPPLENAGFPVNKNWNGIGSTVNGVIPLEEITHENFNDRLAFFKKEMENIDLSLAGRFYKKLNKWLEDIRQNYKELG